MMKIVCIASDISSEIGLVGRGIANAETVCSPDLGFAGFTELGALYPADLGMCLPSETAALRHETAALRHETAALRHDPAALRHETAALRHDTKALPLYIIDAASSSLDVAFSLSKCEALPVWGGVHAMVQGLGRGQLRRPWVSPRGNVHVSVRLPNVAPFDGLAAAPATGILLCMALKILGIDCRMKWPNDLVVKNSEGAWHKVGGVLLEEREGILLAGIGLNRVAFPSFAALREASLLPAGLLPVSRNGEISRQSLCAFIQSLVSQLRVCYTRCVDEDTKWHTHAARFTAFVGACVRVEEGDCQTPLEGTFLGISEEGALRLLIDGAPRNIFSGSLVWDL